MKKELLHIKLIFSLAIFLHLDTLVSAQPIERRSGKVGISASGGYHTSKIYDQTFSNLSQKGKGWSIGVSTQIEGNSLEHYIAFNYAQTDIKVSSISGLSKYFNGGYWILKKLNFTDDNSLNIGIGAGMSSFLFSRQYTDLINNNYTKEGSLCFDVGFKAKWLPKLADSRLLISNFFRCSAFSFSAQPIFGAYAWQIPSDQPEATQTMLSSLKGTGPQNTLHLVNEISLTYAVSDLISAGIQHQFSYGNMSITRQVSWNTNTISLLCTFTL